MLPIPIYRCPETIRPQHAEEMARIVDLEYRATTGKQNRLPRSDDPVVCASTAGVHGFWSLECNDPEIPNARRSTRS